MRNIVLFCLCLVVVVMVTSSTWGAEETCVDLEFHGFRDGETAKVEEKTYLNVTFHISTTKCTTLPAWFLVKVSYHQANFTINVCSIIFEGQKCEITNLSPYCHCVNDLNGAAQLYMEFKVSGNVSYIWSLSDSTYGQMKKKAQIIFDVSSTATTPEPSSTPTDGGVDKPEVTSDDNKRSSCCCCVTTATTTSRPAYPENCDCLPDAPDGCLVQKRHPRPPVVSTSGV